MLCVISNILGGCILLHFNCDSEGTDYTSSHIIFKQYTYFDGSFTLNIKIKLVHTKGVNILYHINQLSNFSALVISCVVSV